MTKTTRNQRRRARKRKMMALVRAEKKESGMLYPDVPFWGNETCVTEYLGTILSIGDVYRLVNTQHIVFIRRSAEPQDYTIRWDRHLDGELQPVQAMLKLTQGLT